MATIIQFSSRTRVAGPTVSPKKAVPSTSTIPAETIRDLEDMLRIRPGAFEVFNSWISNEAIQLKAQFAAGERFQDGAR